MKTTDPSASRSWCRLLKLGPAAAILLPLLGVGGCGSSSSSGDAFSEFEGTWRLETTSTAQLTCDNFGTNGVNSPLPLWDRVVMAAGTVSDLIETAGPADCQFAFDATGKMATVLAIDPFTTKAPACSVLINSGTDSVGDLHDLTLDMAPKPWSFNLLAPVAGQPPTAQLIGSAASTLTDFDVDANMTVDSDSTCLYTVHFDLAKIAK